jgi:hypothetical protein
MKWELTYKQLNLIPEPYRSEAIYEIKLNKEAEEENARTRKKSRSVI